MVVTVRKHNGVNYVEHSVTPTPVRATFTHNRRHYVLEGKSAIVEMTNSWKYGHELHITVHCSPNFVVEKPPNVTNWTRIEIAVPYNVGVQWLARGLDSIYEGTGKPVNSTEEISSFI